MSPSSTHLLISPPSSHNNSPSLHVSLPRTQKDQENGIRSQSGSSHMNFHIPQSGGQQIPWAILSAGRNCGNHGASTSRTGEVRPPGCDLPVRRRNERDCGSRPCSRAKKSATVSARAARVAVEGGFQPIGAFQPVFTRRGSLFNTSIVRTELPPRRRIVHQEY